MPRERHATPKQGWTSCASIGRRSRCRQENAIEVVMAVRLVAADIRALPGWQADGPGLNQRRPSRRRRPSRILPTARTVRKLSGRHAWPHGHSGRCRTSSVAGATEGRPSWREMPAAGAGYRKAARRGGGHSGYEGDAIAPLDTGLPQRRRASFRGCPERDSHLPIPTQHQLPGSRTPSTIHRSPIMQKLALISLALLALARSIHAAPQGVVVMPAGQVSIGQARSAPDYRHAQSVQPVAGPMPAKAFDFNAAAVAGNASPAAGEPGNRGGNLDASALSRTLVGATLLDDSTESLMGMSRASPASTRIPMAVGTQGLQFTSSQIYPAQADTSYPTRVTGKLFFEKVPGSGSWWVCSASMIKPGIIATAGHCVSSGTGSWYGSFQFVPGYRSGAAPYGVWASWSSATTTGEWFSGGGGVPNGGDYALIVLNKNGSGYRIGDYTGWLGWQYPSLVGKHVSVLGYPNNLDSGVINHRIDAQATSGSNNTGLWGSDMTGGSSGGAVVLNLSAGYASSTPLPSDDGGNRLVSVVSYGPIATDPNYQGGAVFDSRFSSMLTNMCTSYAWAC
jgi:V8-like Glu-specific endopeptidase